MPALLSYIIMIFKYSYTTLTDIKSPNNLLLNFVIKHENLWTGRDLNPWPPPCEGDDLPLIYQP